MHACSPLPCLTSVYVLFMAGFMSRLADLRAEGTSPLWYCGQVLRRGLTGCRIATHQKARIIGRRNIHVEGFLKVGTGIPFGFLCPDDRTLLNIRGRLNVRGQFVIGRGCRVCVDPGAELTLNSGYIAPFSQLIIRHGLEIGERCAISWNCELLDEDFHHLEPGKPTGAPIRIGNRVWVGSGAKILKGVWIADGSVVAANSVVTKRFEEPNTLLGGVPARVLRTGISWHL